MNSSSQGKTSSEQFLFSKYKGVQVPYEVLQSMVTQHGESVAVLSKKHKIMLVFMRHFGCCFCKATVDDIRKLFPTLIKLNTIPVFVHMESKEEAEKFFNSWGCEIIKNFYRVEDTTGKFFYSKFGIKDGTKLQNWHPRTTVPGAYYAAKYGNTTTSSDPQRVSVPRMPGLFILENGKIVHEYKYDYVGSRPDYLKVLIDPYFSGDVSEPTVDIDQIDHLKKFKSLVNKNDNRKTTRTSNRWQMTSCFCSAEPFEEQRNSDINVREVIKDRKSRRFFKLYASKEFSVENILFWEEVQKYKASKNKKQHAEQILQNFLSRDAIYELNINRKLIEKVKEKLEKEGPTTTLFDKVVLEIETTVMQDTYGRFRKSALFKEMVQTKRKSRKSVRNLFQSTQED